MITPETTHPVWGELPTHPIIRGEYLLSKLGWLPDYSYQEVTDQDSHRLGLRQNYPFDYIVGKFPYKSNMGLISPAYNLPRDQLFCLKQVVPANESPKLSSLLHHEAQMQARASHPHSVPIIDYFISVEGVGYIVMDYLHPPKYPTLEKLTKEYSLKPRHILNIIKPLAEYLDWLHARKKMVHGDFKPANILIDLDNQLKPKVLDYGLAIKNAEPSQGYIDLVGTNSILGTPDYLSPWRSLGEYPTPACDRYAFYLIAFEMLTGTHPFKKNSDTSQTMSNIATNNKVSTGIPQLIRRGIPNDIAIKIGDIFEVALSHFPVQSDSLPLSKKVPAIVEKYYPNPNPCYNSATDFFHDLQSVLASLI